MVFLLETFRLTVQYECSALVGNPNFAIIDEAYPYIARKLLTDKSPRLRAALRYMVYGRGGDLNAENLIDLLQALEKFVAVRNDGDGSAFKNNGIRGYKFVGSAGDFRGSQRVDTTDREVDGTAGRFRLTASSTPSSETTQKMEDQSTVRKALNFFFSAEGEVFREFILEEVVSVVDTLSRDASQELARRVGLGNFPFPSILRAINPELSAQDKRVRHFKCRVLPANIDSVDLALIFWIPASATNSETCEIPPRGFRGRCEHYSASKHYSGDSIIFFGTKGVWHPGDC